MNAAVCAPKWSKWLLLLLASCSSATPAPPQSHFSVQSCSPDPAQRQPLTLVLANQRWVLRHLPQNRSLTIAATNWQGPQILYPFGENTLLFEATVENTGDTPLQITEQPLLLLSAQGNLANIPTARLVKNWPPEPTSALGVQRRSLALTDVLTQALGARTLLPGRTTRGLLAFEDQSQTLEQIRLNQDDSPILSLCKHGMELLTQRVTASGQPLGLP